MDRIYYKNLLQLLSGYIVDREELLKDALFIVGPISFNDYGLALYRGKSFEEMRRLVLDVVLHIQNAIEVSYVIFHTIQVANTLIYINFVLICGCVLDRI